jgi:hypothetical protein
MSSLAGPASPFSMPWPAECLGEALRPPPLECMGGMKLPTGPAKGRKEGQMASTPPPPPPTTTTSNHQHTAEGTIGPAGFRAAVILRCDGLKEKVEGHKHTGAESLMASRIGDHQIAIKVLGSYRPSGKPEVEPLR